MRGKRIVLGILSGLTAWSLTTCVFANEMSVPYGWYIEANAGSSHVSHLSLPGSTSSSGIGGNVNLGYKFMPYVGAELGASRYANTSVSSGSTKAATGKHYSYDLAVKGIVPISNSGFEIFAKLGAGRIRTQISISNQTAANTLGIGSSTHSATGLYIGAGVQYYMMSELAIVAQWQRVNGNSSTGTEELLSLGLSFIVD